MVTLDAGDTEDIRQCDRYKVDYLSGEKGSK